MALKNFGQLLQETYRYFYVDFNAGEADESTVIPLSLMKNFINDTGRETTVSFGTKWKFREGSMPFYHRVEYQNLYLSGVSTASGTQISGTLNAPEFLNVGSNPTNYLINYPSYSGIAFIGVDPSGSSLSGISYAGNVVTSVYHGLGYQYEMNNDVSHIEGIFINNKGFLSMGQMQRRMMALPQDIVNISGVPSTYYEQPISASGNLMVTFDTSPDNSLLNDSFLYLYEKKFQDMVEVNDVQTLIPEEFQNILIFGALEKAYAFRQNEMSTVYKTKKDDLMWEMIRNSERYTNYTVSWFPGDLVQGWNSYPYGPGGLNTGYFY